MDDYTPQKHDRYWLFALQLDECGHCKRPMLPYGARDGNRAVRTVVRNLFPSYYRDRLEEQMLRAGIRWGAEVRDAEEQRLCEQCAALHSAFVCALCNQERQRAEIQQSFGDPPEHLCAVCYESVSAAQWERETDRLHERHKYDFD